MKINTALYILVPALLILTNSCKDSPSEDNNIEGFYYFPETNVYFDAEANLYNYSLDSGKTWFSYNAVADSIKPMQGIKVVVRPVGNEPVWEKNADHVKMYNGNLLRIITADTGIIKPTKKEEIKVVKKTPVDTPTVVTKEKKPNLFQRVFKKKKKNNS